MSARLKLLVCVCVAGIASLAWAASAAADWTVNDTGNGSDLVDDDVCEVTSGGADCTLRAALQESNNNVADLDTITFEAGLGTIVVSGTQLLVEGPTTIDGNGSSGAGATVIDGNDAVRVFAAFPLTGGSTLTFKDVRIEDGAVTAGGAGAGISTSMDTVITDSAITSNSISGGDGFGAGIAMPGGDNTLTIENSEITDNTITTGPASGFGAGVYAGYRLSLTDSTVSGNSINGAGHDEQFVDQAEGGGIWSNLDLTIVGSTISGNSVTNNTADDLGLARAAGVLAAQETPTITNSTISGNVNSGSEGIAGGARLLPSSTLTNVTFANNSAPSGADLASEFETATVANTIFASSGACAGNVASATPGNNIDSGTTCGLGTDDGNMESTNPQLVGPAQAGGPPLQTVFIPLPTSPAIDNADAGCGGGLTVDQRGRERPQGPACDIGAYERDYRDLSVTVVGSGTVTGTGINCGSDCMHEFLDGDPAYTLTATPAAGFQLESWSAGGCTSTSGNQCTVNTGNDVLVTATFTELPPSGGGGGTTTPPPTPPKKCKKGQKLKKGKCVKKKKKKRKKK